MASQKKCDVIIITYEPWLTGVIREYTTLARDRWKFAVSTLTSGGIFAEYTYQPLFIYYIYHNDDITLY